MDWYERAQRQFDSWAHVYGGGEPIITADDYVAAVEAYDIFFRELVGKLKIRDVFPMCVVPNPVLRNVLVYRPEKLQSEISFGISFGVGWYISAQFSYPEEIRHMDDRYWEHLVELSKVGKAEIESGGSPEGRRSTERTRKLGASNHSLVLAVARDYVFMASETDDPFEFSGMGSISLTLPDDQAARPAVREFLKNGLLHLYRSNYLLYRSHYQKVKRGKR